MNFKKDENSELCKKLCWTYMNPLKFNMVSVLVSMELRNLKTENMLPLLFCDKIVISMFH